MTKTNKEISKLNKIPHPKGRKTVQLTKKVIRVSGREKVKVAHQMKVNLTGEKLLWFKDNLEDVDLYTPELTIKLIEKYLGRFDEELEQIQIKHSTGMRKGRQHANREDIIKMTIKNERNEFESCGIEMPDILIPKQLKLLKDWSGELRFLQNFRMVRYNKTRLQNLINSKKNCKTVKNEEDETEEMKVDGWENGKEEEKKTNEVEEMDEKKEQQEEKKDEKEIEQNEEKKTKNSNKAENETEEGKEEKMEID